MGMLSSHAGNIVCPVRVIDRPITTVNLIRGEINTMKVQRSAVAATTTTKMAAADVEMSVDPYQNSIERPGRYIFT